MISPRSSASQTSTSSGSSRCAVTDASDQLCTSVSTPSPVRALAPLKACTSTSAPSRTSTTAPRSRSRTTRQPWDNAGASASITTALSGIPSKRSSPRGSSGIGSAMRDVWGLG